MYTFLLVSSLAAASTGHSGLLLPGAASIPGQSGQIDAGVAILPLTEDAPPMTVAGVGLTLSPSKRLTLNVQYGTQTDHVGLPTAGFGAVGGRLAIIDTKVLRIAPMGYALFTAEGPKDVFTSPEFTLGGIGAAVEVGAQRVYVDASVPVIAALPGGKFEIAENGMDAFTRSEVGINVVPKDGHHIRLGMLAMMPMVSYQLDVKHFQVRAAAGAATTGEKLAPATMVQTGLTF